MTETRVAYQPDFFGGVHVSGDVVDKLRALLHDDAEARNDNNTMVVRYLARYHNLDATTAARLEQVMAHAPSFKTLLNRAMEIQGREPELAPDADVRAQRDRRAKAGPVRR